jgi:hypothetical protein
MVFRRLLFVISMALAAVAFAAPAAQAETWFSDPGEVELGGSEEEATPITLAGELSSTASSFTTGPAEVHGSGYLWNEEGEAVGTITSFSATGELLIQGVPPSCTVTTTPENLPWKIRVTPLFFIQQIDTKDVQFTTHYNHACQTLGFPSTATITGTLTGDWTDATGFVYYKGHGDLTVAGGLVPVTVSGEVGFEGPEGETFTLK